VTATAAPVATPEPVAVAGGAPSPPPERPAEKVVPAREQDFPARVPGGEIGGEPGGEIGGEPGGVVGSATEPSLGDVLRGTGLAPPSTATLPFGEGMTRPVLLSGRQPQYTAEALDAKVEGKVIARCTITREGRLVACKIIKGLPGLDNEVLAALATQRYRPVLYQGKPQAVFYTLPFRFKLDAPPPPKPGG
jgi:protein TonB